MPLGTSASNEPARADDGEYDYSWGPLKPYMDGETLVIPVMDVIADSFWGSGLSAKSVQKALLKYKDATSIRLVINSPGGEVHEGTAIYSLLVADARPVEAHVIGLAASMASIVLLAASVRILHTGAMVMIHEPSLWYTGGKAHKLQGDVNRLLATAASMLDIYVERTGQDRAALEALMADETWLTAEEARRYGFGTEVAPVVAEPRMSTASADAAWNERRGAALAKYQCLPAAAQHGASLGWSGPSLAELRAANALADTHQFPTLVAALDGVRRARPTAQQPIPAPREATPPPRPAPQPQPAASTNRTTSMDEATLRALGLTPGATPEQIAAAVASLNSKTAELEARAKAEAQARLEAEAKTKIAEEQRRREEAEAAEAKALADWTAKVSSELLEDTTPSLRADFEAMAFHEDVAPDGTKKRRANPDGFARALRMRDTMAGARKSSLSGPSAQVVAAAKVTATSPNATKGPVKYTFKGSNTAIDLTRITGVTHEQVAARQAEMQARAESRGLIPND